MRLIENWKDGWRFYSTWALAVLAALPDLYNLLATSGLFDTAPAELVWTVRVGALLALVARFVSQQKPEPIKAGGTD